MARLTASDYFHQLIGQGMTDAQASAQVAAVMRHRASEDSGAKASLELQKAANYSARANQSGSAGGSGGGASGTDQGLQGLLNWEQQQSQLQQQQAQQSAQAELTSTLQQWGLSSLLGPALGFIQQGMTAPEIELQLQNTPEYKQRFAGNAIRIANGLSALSPADYISLEDQYAQVLQSYGLPKGFYDQHSDFTDFIGKDISPSELQSRAQVAYNQYVNAPDSMKNLWQQYFGTSGDAIAYILDPNRATATIQAQGQQVAIGGAAQAAGLSIGQPRAQELQQAGLTQQQAQQGFQQVAYELQPDQAIAHRFGTQLSQQEIANADLLNNADAIRKRQRLYGEEKALFQGSPGVTGQSLGVSQNY